MTRNSTSSPASSKPPTPSPRPAGTGHLPSLAGRDSAARLRTKSARDGASEPVRISLQRPALGQDQAFVAVDGEVVPQHVAYLLKIDPVAKPTGLEQVATQQRHADQALLVQLRPDRRE